MTAHSLKIWKHQKIDQEKHQKIDQEAQRKRDILRQQREEEDFCDEYKDFSLESSSDESNCDRFIQDDSSKKEELVTKKKRRDSKYEGLGDDNDRRV